VGDWPGLKVTVAPSVVWVSFPRLWGIFLLIICISAVGRLSGNIGACYTYRLAYIDLAHVLHGQCSLDDGHGLDGDLVAETFTLSI